MFSHACDSVECPTNNLPLRLQSDFSPAPVQFGSSSFSLRSLHSISIHSIHSLCCNTAHLCVSAAAQVPAASTDGDAKRLRALLNSLNTRAGQMSALRTKQERTEQRGWRRLLPGALCCVQTRTSFLAVACGQLTASTQLLHSSCTVSEQSLYSTHRH